MLTECLGGSSGSKGQDQKLLGVNEGGKADKAECHSGGKEFREELYEHITAGKVTLIGAPYVGKTGGDQEKYSNHMA